MDSGTILPGICINVLRIVANFLDVACLPGIAVNLPGSGTHPLGGIVNLLGGGDSFSLEHLVSGERPHLCLWPCFFCPLLSSS